MKPIASFRRYIRSHLPVPILEWWQRRLNAHVINKSPEQVFSGIYHDNLWQSAESRSGGGSAIHSTAAAREAIRDLLVDLNIHSLHDIPCGDFNWMRMTDLGDCKYIGSDIVPELIEEVRKKFAADNREFRVMNLCTDSLPAVDLVMVRDCFIHLSFEHLTAAIRNIKASGSKYLLASTYPNHRRNYDTPTGGARPINLCSPPFFFPPPMRMISETKVLDNSHDPNDKSLGLWLIRDLPDPK